MIGHLNPLQPRGETVDDIPKSTLLAQVSSPQAMVAGPQEEKWGLKYEI
jgi:hypothetical protein